MQHEMFKFLDLTRFAELYPGCEFRMRMAPLCRRMNITRVGNYETQLIERLEQMLGGAFAFRDDVDSRLGFTVWVYFAREEDYNLVRLVYGI